jgi:hypothetical protein
VSRRHADVDHDQVRWGFAHGGQQLFGIPCLRYDREARAVEEPRKALAQQHIVVRHDYAPAWTLG